MIFLREEILRGTGEKMKRVTRVLFVFLLFPSTKKYRSGIFIIKAHGDF